MGIVKGIVANYLVLVATAVALHFVLEPLYQDNVNTGRVWDTLNWFMAVGTLAILLVWLVRKVQLGNQSEAETTTRRYLEVHVALYAAVVLTLWFFWNWFDNFTAELGQNSVHLQIWTLVNPLFVLLAGVTGYHLWPRPRDKR